MTSGMPCPLIANRVGHKRTAHTLCISIYRLLGRADALQI